MDEHVELHPAPKGTLKPCPFCGAVAALACDGGLYWVRCTARDCGIPTTVRTTEAAVVAAWNRRADYATAPTVGPYLSDERKAEMSVECLRELDWDGEGAIIRAPAQDVRALLAELAATKAALAAAEAKLARFAEVSREMFAMLRRGVDDTMEDAIADAREELRTAPPGSAVHVAARLFLACAEATGAAAEAARAGAGGGE